MPRILPTVYFCYVYSPYAPLRSIIFQLSSGIDAQDGGFTKRDPVLCPQNG